MPRPALYRHDAQHPGDDTRLRRRGARAAAIGIVEADEHRFVQMRTRFGGRRIVDWLSGVEPSQIWVAHRGTLLMLAGIVAATQMGKVPPALPAIRAELDTQMQIALRDLALVLPLLDALLLLLLALLIGPAVCAGEPGAEASRFDLMSMLFVFMLSTFIGLQVISRVSRLLHTPLMSLTNAISAIAVVGAILIVLAIKQWVINPYRIPSSSMEPTLHCARPGLGCEASFSDQASAPGGGPRATIRTPARSSAARRSRDCCPVPVRCPTGSGASRGRRLRPRAPAGRRA